MTPTSEQVNLQLRQMLADVMLQLATAYAEIALLRAALPKDSRMPEPWPKLLVNMEGKQVRVSSFEEQDAWTAKGYFRSLGRKVELDEAAQAKKQAS